MFCAPNDRRRPFSYHTAHLAHLAPFILLSTCLLALQTVNILDGEIKKLKEDNLRWVLMDKPCGILWKP